MDDESMMTSSKVKGEAGSKIKDGYVQLAEKMEQVKNQVAKMERKYDELYQSVKEKEHGRNTGVASSNQESPEEMKNMAEAKSALEAEASAPSTDASTALRQSTAPEDNQAKAQEKPADGKKATPDMDIEKLEDNPFL